MELFGDSVIADNLFKEYNPDVVNSPGHSGILYTHWKTVRHQLVQGGFIKVSKRGKKRRKRGRGKFFLTFQSKSMSQMCFCVFNVLIIGLSG